MTGPLDAELSAPLDPIRLEVWWSRLAAIADEAATALLRTAFSTIIRESNDYTVVLMDPAGQTIAECRAGIPAFMAATSCAVGPDCGVEVDGQHNLIIDIDYDAGEVATG